MYKLSNLAIQFDSRVNCDQVGRADTAVTMQRVRTRNRHVTFGGHCIPASYWLPSCMDVSWLHIVERPKKRLHRRFSDIVPRVHVVINCKEISSASAGS